MELKCKGVSQGAYTEDILEWKKVEQKYAKTGRKLDPSLFQDLLTGAQDKQSFLFPESFKRDGKNQTITSFTALKSLRLVYDKRVLL